MNTQDKITLLRKQLSKHNSFGFVIPRHDLFQGEYIAAYDERLNWISGFSGSAGLAVVTQEECALFVDGRYTLQAAQEVDQSIFSIYNSGDFAFSDWLEHKAKNTQKSQIILYDPWLHTPKQIDYYNKFCTPHLALKAGPCNLIDEIWVDNRTPLGNLPAFAHDIEYSGKSSFDKLNELLQKMKDKGVDNAFLTTPESVCWLLNIRGQDVPMTPVVNCFAFIHADKTIDLFVRCADINTDLFPNLNVKIHSFDSFYEIIQTLSGKTLWVDQNSIPLHLMGLLINHNCQVLSLGDPCAIARASKNEIEQKGTRNAHMKDGFAVINFWYWLETQLKNKVSLTEMDCVEKLEYYRTLQPLYCGPSFSTISGSGPNGAIIHYRVSEKTNRTLQNNDIFLLDSGGQYRDGTTDITRTISLNGQPTAEQKDRYTLVLKGHIALAQAQFPKGTTGSHLDVLARAPLWKAGFDYDHGTGHGVGSYLNVHEGPQRISKAHNDVALIEGMILSNEPGYYKPNEYGIRIENLILVTPAPKAGEPDMLCFETLTLVPFDLSLVEISLLDKSEIDWINTYHALIYKTYKDTLDAQTGQWLKSKTQAIS